MATKQRTLDISARTFAVGSVLAVLFGTAAVIVGNPTLAGVGAMSVIVGVVALLLAVGRYIGD